LITLNSKGSKMVGQTYNNFLQKKDVAVTTPFPTSRLFSWGSKYALPGMSIEQTNQLKFWENKGYSRFS
jgi:hypothetical protein